MVSANFTPVQPSPIKFHLSDWQWIYHKVEADSMAPSFNPGDVIAVDSSVTWWARDGVYLVNFPDEVQMLRRIVKPTPSLDRYRVVCDNPRYVTEDIDGDLLEGKIAGIAIICGSTRLV